MQGTVGAGLPVIGTLKHLLETGDKAQTIEGIFSGTLSYIFNTFGDGRPFSEIVAGAKAEVGEGVGVGVIWHVEVGGRAREGPGGHMCVSLLGE